LELTPATRRFHLWAHGTPCTRCARTPQSLPRVGAKSVFNATGQVRQIEASDAPAQHCCVVTSCLDASWWGNTWHSFDLKVGMYTTEEQVRCKLDKERNGQSWRCRGSPRRSDKGENLNLRGWVKASAVRLLDRLNRFGRRERGNEPRAGQGMSG
jgi:hypothetical protein